MKAVKLISFIFGLIIINLLGIQKIESQDLPADFPKITIDSLVQPAPGFIFMNSISFMNKTVNYNFIIDSVGNVVYYDKKPLGAIDFKMQPNGLFSYGSPIMLGDKYQAGPLTVQNVMVQEIVLDSNYTPIDTVQMKNGYLADVHEFVMLPNGNYLMLAYEKNPVDMSQVLKGGDPNAFVVGTVIQELDHNKKCLFQWRSLDYIPLLETIDNPLKTTFEHVHGNSLFIDTDGNLIASFPTINAIAKIDMVSGKILWRLGGPHSDFTISNEHQEYAPIYFSMQHDVKKLPNGNLLFLDNGVAKKDWYSRAVEYSIDEDKKQASLVWEYRHNPDISAYAMGSVQRLSNGNTLIDWGLIFKGLYKTLTEVNDKNEMMFEMSIPSDAYSYRALKYNLPACQPVANVDQYEILEGNTYSFKDKKSNSGAEIYFKQLDAFIYNMMNIKKYDCAPINPLFDGEAPVVLPCRFVITSQEIKSYSGEIRFDCNLLPKLMLPSEMEVFYRPTEGTGTFIPLTSSFNETQNTIVAQVSDTGEYIIGLYRNPTEIFAPSLLYPWDNKVYVNSQNVILNWSPTGRYNQSELQIATNKDFQNIIMDTTIAENTKFIATFEPSQQLYWRVKTKYQSLESPWSVVRTFSFAEPFVKILKPANSEIVTRDSSYIIRWNTNVTDSVKITLLKNDAELLTIADSLFSFTSAFKWTIPVSVPDGNDYKIKIESIKNSGEQVISELPFTITNGNDVKDKSIMSNAIKISNYPNPMNNVTVFDFSIREPGKVTLELFDLLGNFVGQLFVTSLEAGNYKYNWNNSNYQPGVYYYKISEGENTAFGKLVIIE